MPTLQDRMADLFPPEGRKRGLSARLASLCEVSTASVSAWFNLPEKVKELDLAYAEIICDVYAPHINPKWLSKGTAPKLRPTEYVQALNVEDRAVREYAHPPTLEKALTGISLALEELPPHVNKMGREALVRFVLGEATARETQEYMQWLTTAPNISSA